jgi:hypothetical protein
MMLPSKWFYPFRQRTFKGMFMRAMLGAVLAALMLLTPNSRAAPPAPISADTEVALTNECTEYLLNILTPARVRTQGDLFTLTGAEGKISIGKNDVAAAVRLASGISLLGVDCDGDGKIGNNEWQKIGGDGKAGFRIKLGPEKRECAVLMKSVAVVHKDNVATGGGGRFFALACKKGTAGGKTIRLLDENLDGKFTFDGADSIVIGDGITAMPLQKTHMIGTQNCQLSLNDDASKLTLTPLGDLPSGQVETTLQGPALRALVMVDKANSRAYDLVAGAKSIPAGNYVLSYGILASGSTIIPILPAGANPASYEITADNINKLRLGAPLKLLFRASMTGEKLNVIPALGVVGAGGESYEWDFRTPPAPHFRLGEGNRVLLEKTFDYG